MILLEPAYTITHLMVEIKRRTISLTVLLIVIPAYLLLSGSFYYMFKSRSR